MDKLIVALLPLLAGWLLDLLLGDPARLPHPVVWFGKAIAFFEHRLNRGRHRRLKGALTAVSLIAAVFVATWLLRNGIFYLHRTNTDFHGLLSWLADVMSESVRVSPLLFMSESVRVSPLLFMSESVRVSPLLIIFDAVIIFYCLAGTTLIREVRQVFLALDRSLEDGRRQVARIVGRDTSQLSAQEVRTAALETLAENLSDGVIAPLFWYALLGIPGMLAYKMVNTLDSMIGYKTARYKDFGCWAAHIDDVANFIPARLTALLMVVAEGRLGLIRFVWKNGGRHASPNSGYPEAALAGILNCRFGGPHYYFGQLFDKPFIGTNDRPLTTEDMKTAVRINRIAEILMVLLTAAVLSL